MSTSLLQDKVALITGAGSGIGRAVAIALAQAGAQVVLAARTSHTIDEVAQTIVASGGQARAIPTDVGDESQVERLMAQISSQSGRLDILVTSAGGAIFGPLSDSRTEDWDSVLTANLKGVYLSCKHALKLMLPNKQGHILNVLSIASTMILPNSTAYTASKFGALGFTKVMAAEVRSQGIKVTAVIPGAVNTPLWDKSGGDLDRSKMLLPEDIANAMLNIITQPSTIYTDEIVLMPPLGVL
jgi:3-oxoacyl-[acyl-carrier protein] reductase